MGGVWGGDWMVAVDTAIKRPRAEARPIVLVDVPLNLRDFDRQARLEAIHQIAQTEHRRRRFLWR